MSSLLEPDSTDTDILYMDKYNWQFEQIHSTIWSNPSSRIPNSSAPRQINHPWRYRHHRSAGVKTTGKNGFLKKKSDVWKI